MKQVRNLALDNSLYSELASRISLTFTISVGKITTEIRFTALFRRLSYLLAVL